MNAIDWDARKEAWEGRAQRLGKRAVLHVGHGTPEAQEKIYQVQYDTIIPLWQKAIAKQGYQRILDFGCGVGRWTDTLQRTSDANVLGVDPTETFLSTCIRENENPRVEFRLYEHGRIPAKDESVDAIWACMVLSTILDVEGGMFEHTIRELKRVLVPGGLMFLVDNTEGRGGHPVRSPYSISRTIEQYNAAFRPWCSQFQPRGEYVDLGEKNTIFYGWKR